MQVQGEFKMQAHSISSVVVDIAAFKVSHSIGPDIDTTTLRAARARSSSIHRGNGTLHAWVRFGAKLTLPCHDTPPTVSIPLGRWMKVHGEFKMQAHITSSVVVDIAAFKVCHSVGIDKNATALRAARARSPHPWGQ
jgi:hypothetical protein